MTTINPFNYSDAAHTPDKGAWVEIGSEEWWALKYVGHTYRDVGPDGTWSYYGGRDGDPDHLEAPGHYWKWVPHATPSRVSILEDMVPESCGWVADDEYVIQFRGIGGASNFLLRKGRWIADGIKSAIYRTRLPLSQYVAGDSQERARVALEAEAKAARARAESYCLRLGDAETKSKRLESERDCFRARVRELEAAAAGSAAPEGKCPVHFSYSEGDRTGTLYATVGEKIIALQEFGPFTDLRTALESRLSVLEKKEGGK